MKKWLPLLLAFAIGALVGYAYARWTIYIPPPYSQVRSGFVMQEAAQFGDADTLIIGDSLIEQAYLSGACGRTFVAGVGAARIEDIADLAPAIVESTTPELIVLAIGANHFTLRDEIGSFARDYPALVNTLPKPLVLVGVVNSEAGNAVVERTAENTGSIFVPPIMGPMQADGLHHTSIGSLRLRKAIENACHSRPIATRRVSA